MEPQQIFWLIFVGIFKLFLKFHLWYLKGLGKAMVFLFNNMRGWRSWSLGRRQMILGPGDPPPMADRIQDYWDYRGVAEEGN